MDLLVPKIAKASSPSSIPSPAFLLLRLMLVSLSLSQRHSLHLHQSMQTKKNQK